MGEYIAQVKNITEVLEDTKPSSSYPTGLRDADKGYTRYAPKSSDYPNLIIADYIYDSENNVIVPGYYQLILSSDRQMLVLAQSEKIIATFPVFKLEEDKTQEEPQPPQERIALWKYNREQKKKEKETQKLIKEGKIPPEQEIYANATIEYEKIKDYYLVKYERGKIRAWGVIK